MGEQIVCNVSESSEVGVVRRQAVALALKAGFDVTDAGKAALIATELATNIVRHAGRGQTLLQIIGKGDTAQLEILSIDSGPGMKNVAECLRDGFSSAGTAGTGLGAVKRMSTEFELYTQPGKG